MEYHYLVVVHKALFDDIRCYDLTFSMVDVNGCDTSKTYQISCIEEAVAAFTVSPNTIGPGNSTVHFYNESFGAENYIWNFGDGNSSYEDEDLINIIPH